VPDLPSMACPVQHRKGHSPAVCGERAGVVPVTVSFVSVAGESNSTARETCVRATMTQNFCLFKNLDCFVLFKVYTDRIVLLQFCS
jgi:hypothetical protein